MTNFAAPEPTSGGIEIPKPSTPDLEGLLRTARESMDAVPFQEPQPSGPNEWGALGVRQRQQQVCR